MGVAPPNRSYAYVRALEAYRGMPVAGYFYIRGYQTIIYLQVYLNTCIKGLTCGLLVVYWVHGTNELAERRKEQIMELRQFPMEERKELIQKGFLRVTSQYDVTEYNMPNPRKNVILERHTGLERACIWTDWSE